MRASVSYYLLLLLIATAATVLFFTLLYFFVLFFYFLPLWFGCKAEQAKQSKAKQASKRVYIVLSVFLDI